MRHAVLLSLFVTSVLGKVKDQSSETSLKTDLFASSTPSCEGTLTYTGYIPLQTVTVTVDGNYTYTGATNGSNPTAAIFYTPPPPCASIVVPEPTAVGNSTEISGSSSSTEVSIFTSTSVSLKIWTQTLTRTNCSTIRSHMSTTSRTGAPYGNSSTTKTTLDTETTLDITSCTPDIYFSTHTDSETYTTVVTTNIESASPSPIVATTHGFVPLVPQPAESTASNTRGVPGKLTAGGTSAAQTSVATVTVTKKTPVMAPASNTSPQIAFPGGTSSGVGSVNNIVSKTTAKTSANVGGANTNGASTNGAKTNGPNTGGANTGAGTNSGENSTPTSKSSPDGGNNNPASNGNSPTVGNAGPTGGSNNSGNNAATNNSPNGATKTPTEGTSSAGNKGINSPATGTPVVSNGNNAPEGTSAGGNNKPAGASTPTGNNNNSAGSGTSTGNGNNPTGGSDNNPASVNNSPSITTSRAGGGYGSIINSAFNSPFTSVGIATSYGAASATVTMVNGVPVQVQSSSVYIGGSYVALPSGTSVAVVTIAGQTFTVQAEAVIGASSTLEIQRSTSVSYSAVQAATLRASTITQNGVVVTIQPTAAIVNGKTYSIGLNAEATTLVVSGQTVTLNSNGVAFASTTYLPAMTTAAAYVVSTIGGLTFSIDSSQAIISGTTYRIGAGALNTIATTTIDGTTIMFGSSGIILPSTTIAPTGVSMTSANAQSSGTSGSATVKAVSDVTGTPTSSSKISGGTSSAIRLSTHFSNTLCVSSMLLAFCTLPLSLLL